MAHLKKAASKHPKARESKPSSTSQFATGVTGEQFVPITYDITVFSTSGEQAFSFNHEAPPSRFSTQALEGELIAGMVQLHERGVFEGRAWTCMNCEKQAVSFASWHVSALRSTPAGARTIAFPICEVKGPCHQNAEAIWAHTSAQLGKQGGIGVQEVDTETGEVGAQQLNEQGPIIDID